MPGHKGWQPCAKRVETEEASLRPSVSARCGPESMQTENCLGDGAGLAHPILKPGLREARLVMLAQAK